MRYVTSITALIVLFCIQIHASIPATPDFAFPKRVSAEANRSLKQALSASDGPGIVRAVMDYTLAQGAVDTDNISASLSRIDSVRGLESVSPVTRSILSLLMADIYAQLYNQKRWVYDQREIAATQPPVNYEEWSGQQFRECISSLTDTALSAADRLFATPLSQWSAVISCEVDSRPCFPTLYDFAAYKAINLFSDLYPQPTAEQRQNTIDIYRQLFQFHSADTPPSIYANIQYIAYTNGNSRRYSRERMFDSLMQLYTSSAASSSFSGLILSELHNYSSTTAEQQQLHDSCTGWLTHYADAASTPQRGLIPSVRSIISQLEQQRLNALFNNVTTNRHPLEVKLSSHNATSCTVEVYRLPDSYRHGDRINSLPSTAITKVESRQISINGSGIFDTDTTITLSPLPYGNYLLSILLPNQQFNIKNTGYSDVFTVTDLSLQETRFGNSVSILIVNPLTGAPQSGISLNGLTDTSATTNNYGMYHVNQNLNYDNKIYAVAYDDRYARPLQLYHNSGHNSDKPVSHCNLFTDLAIYHPGDTVRFGGVAYEYRPDTPKGAHILPNKTAKVILKNSNNIGLDTIECTTDRFGRISGQFILPADDITGWFGINLAYEFTSSGVSFMVSDYKLPTYTLKTTEILRNRPEEGSVTLLIKAETYSGFPVSDAEVSLNLSQTARNWWWRANAGGQTFYTARAVTNANGMTEFVIPAQILNDAPISDGIFTATITSTSQSGETCETSTAFTQGPSNILSLSFPANFDISSKQLRLPVSVTDLSGNAVDIPLHYTLSQGESVVREGDFSPTTPIIDWSSIKSGVYSITVAPVDSSQALPQTVSDIVFYRPSDKTMPTKSDLWVPVSSYSVTNDNTAKILYGTSNANGYILCTLFSADSILSQQWLHVHSGIHTYEVRLPRDMREATLSMATMYDFEQSGSTIHIERADVATSLTIAIDAFRDHITPGQQEHWKIRVTDNTGGATASGVILDMYSKALDVLQPHHLGLQFRTGQSSFFRLGWPNASNKETIYCQSKLNRRYNFSVIQPGFNTYRRSFLPQTFYGMRLMKAEARGTADLTVAREHKEEVVVEEAYAAVAYNSAADAGSLSEIAIVNDDAAITGSAEAEATAEPGTAADSYRLPEQPLAFFRPMLTTDANGQLEFSFTAPNANTTWRLCAATFTPDLLTGSVTREIISNKPVMIQPNLPRFLRTGDSATIRSTVMNNTDSTLYATTVTELFDPASGIVTSVITDSLTLQAGTSSTVTCTVNAPEESPFIGFRIRARIPGFSDGEQSVIPVLPATTPVIETIPFYMAPDSTRLTVNLPVTGTDHRVTLQMCSNPAWYCVTALPGLRTDEGNTANSAAAAIFSAAISDGLLREYPQIADALHQWNISDRSDSTLVSMLERNQDLKTALLNATPWMLDARSDTERMMRLSLLFDRKEIDRCYSQAITRLSKLSRKGGWAWAECFNEPSTWTTYNVLTMMGRLRQLGYMPNNKQLLAMITDALDYIDRQAAETYTKYPKSDFTQYTFVRGLFADVPQPTGAAAASRAAVQRLVRDWRHMTVTDKAVAAIVLNRNNYKTLSRQIISSLDQYAKSAPQRGMWWPSLDQYYGWSMSKIGATALILDAYTLITPDSRRIDDIRQWLILQKEAKNWGTSVTTADVIASILTSGSKWVGSATNLTATIGDHPVQLNITDRQLGYSRTDISSMITGIKSVLTVDKTGNTPAWGAVYNQFTAPMDSVMAAGCDAVSIEKRFFTAQNTPGGIDWTESRNYAVGDRVRVQLTVRVTRDMDYVTIIDDRAAAFEPRVQLPAPIVSEGIYFYQENRDSSTRMFVRHLPKGTYILTYDLNVNNAGQFASGIATIQSQYAPQLTAHSAGSGITVVQ